ncbi:MAG: hypothetical protein QME96_16965 [Myxococcota bacterium]|nr:hypothetical protein [Myxococcota bacterium]
MNDAKKVLVGHPDGRICEIPLEDLEKYVVPAERVKEALGRAAVEAASPDGAEIAAGHSVVVPRSGQTVVFNFYLGPQARLRLHQPAAGDEPERAGGADVEGYHIDLDAFGSMTFHSEWRVGPYIDKGGRPAFGPHSHDPASGNAR